MRSNGIRFGGYGTAHWNGFYLNSIVGAGFHSLGLNRVIALNDDDRWVARGNPGASELDFLLGGGYEYNLGKWRFGVNASGQYTYLGIGGYQETGAGNLDLKVGGQHPGSLMSTVGASVSYIWDITPNIKVVPVAGLSWQHQFSDYSDNIYASFYGGRGPSFFFPSAKGERDDMYGMAGLSLQLGSHFGLFLYYNPIFGGREVLSHGFLTGLNYSF
jgi:outer membrane autotransporter protein